MGQFGQIFHPVFSLLSFTQEFYSIRGGQKIQSGIIGEWSNVYLERNSGLQTVEESKEAFSDSSYFAALRDLKFNNMMNILFRNGNTNPIIHNPSKLLFLLY